MEKNTFVKKHTQLHVHQQSIYAIDGNELFFFTAGADKSVIRYAWNDLENPSIVCKTNHTIYSLLTLSDAVLAVGTSAGLLHVIHLQTKKELKCLQLDGAIFCLYYRFATQQILAATAAGTLYVIDANSYEFIKVIAVGKDKIRSIDVCEKREILALACSDTFVYILHLHDFSVQKSFKAHDWACNVVKFHPETNQLFTASKDAHIGVWNLDNLQCEKLIPAHNYAIYSLDFIQNGKYLISAGRDKMIKLWDVQKMEVLTRFYQNFGGHTHSVNAQFWNTKTNQLVSVGDDRKTIVWDVNI